jgi:hypothetical protein
VRVRLPLEVKGICGEKIAAHRPAPAPHVVINIEEADFLGRVVAAVNAAKPGTYCEVAIPER